MGTPALSIGHKMSIYCPSQMHIMRSVSYVFHLKWVIINFVAGSCIPCRLSVKYGRFILDAVGSSWVFGFTVVNPEARSSGRLLFFLFLLFYRYFP
jgi:dolichyl-phosphate-mannose--protein O-mannosyl transferase